MPTWAGSPLFALGSRHQRRLHAHLAALRRSLKPGASGPLIERSSGVREGCQCRASGPEPGRPSLTTHHQDPGKPHRSATRPSPAPKPHGRPRLTSTSSRPPTADPHERRRLGPPPVHSHPDVAGVRRDYDLCHVATDVVDALRLTGGAPNKLPTHVVHLDRVRPIGP